MNLADKLYSCDDGNILSNKGKLLKIGRILGVESKASNEIPNKGWDMVDREMKVRKIMRSKQIFKEFSEKFLTSLIEPIVYYLYL